MDYLEQRFGLHKKSAVITGGTGAIGTVMADALLRAGAAVTVWCRSEQSLDCFRQRYSGSPQFLDRIHGIVLDTADEQAIVAGFNETSKHFSCPEILVNGMGGNFGKSPFIDVDINRFREIMDLNLIAGLVAPTKIFCKQWVDLAIKGTIINIASTASFNPLSGVWAYDAAKAAIVNLTVATSREFAPNSIRVNAIAPGFFIGKQNKALLINEKSGDYTERGQEVIDHTPFKRFGEMEELAGVTLFLASDKASGFVTGTTITVDGGYLAHNI